MRKTFKLTDQKIKPERQVEAVKYEIKKYIKRERNKKLPDGCDYWDFDCKFGDDADSAAVIHLSAINKAIDAQVLSKKESFYVEILAKTGTRAKTTTKSKTTNEAE